MTVFDHSYWWPWGAAVVFCTVGWVTIVMWSVEWITGRIARRKRERRERGRDNV